MKKILVVDDSALMRRVLCDIINHDKRYEVVQTANNGLEALELLMTNQYDAVVLDVNMPKMTGIELLKELRKRKISAKILMASTDTFDGASVTMEALELGAIDFVHKPGSFLVAQNEEFKTVFLRTLSAVVKCKIPSISKKTVVSSIMDEKIVDTLRKHKEFAKEKKVVAIASSTGGPRALQQIIPFLPEDLKAPVVIVQHMPVGFTKSFANRLNLASNLEVKEAEEGDELLDGNVYLARGGTHLNVVHKNGKNIIHYSDEPTREGVKPCANYMYESLAKCNYDHVICVVLTGMGADGTEGIMQLRKSKKIHVIAQSKETCAVFGMPKSIILKDCVNQVLPIEQIAQEIIMNVGVK